MDQPGALSRDAPVVVRRSTLEALRQLNAEVLRRELGEFISNAEIRGILERRDQIVRYFERLATERGEANVIIDAVDFAPPGSLVPRTSGRGTNPSLGRVRASHPPAPQRLTEAEVVEIVRSQSGIPLGGNTDRAYLVELPNGRQVVYTTRRFHDPTSRANALATLQTTESLSDAGVFARVLGSAVRETGGGRGEVVIIMEYMGVSRSGQPVRAFGDLRTVRDLADLPLQQRQSVRDEILHDLLLHPDPHGMNVMWRRVPTQGGDRVDVRLIDPFSRPNSLLDRAGLFTIPGDTPGVQRQYSPWAQARWLDADLGLPSTAHPDVMLHIGRGYGLAAEAAARDRAPPVDYFPLPRASGGLGSGRPRLRLPTDRSGMPLILLPSTDVAGDADNPFRFSVEYEGGIRVVVPNVQVDGDGDGLRILLPELDRRRPEKRR
jgi:hypothetical protein